jgi:catechol 2,3-dioxygenase-like lactoylglutathione lyase family enzyme
MPAAAITTPGHAGLTVSDLPRSIGFYTDAFGLTLMGEGEARGTRFAFLGDGSRVTLTLWQQGAAPGLHHLAFQAATVDEVRSAEARVRRAGGAMAYEGIVPHAEGAGSGGIYFTDPDGIRLEIYSASGVEGPAPVSGAPTCGFF